MWYKVVQREYHFFCKLTQYLLEWSSIVLNVKKMGMELKISQELLKKLLDMGFDHQEITRIGVQYSKLQYKKRVDLDTMSVKYASCALKIEVLYHLGFTLETIATILELPPVRVSRVIDNLTTNQMCNVN